MPNSAVRGKRVECQNVATVGRQVMTACVEDTRSNRLLNYVGPIGIPFGWVSREGAVSVKRFGQSSSSLAIAACATLIYAVLVVLGAGCMVAHADQIQAHHHHSDEKASSQTAFCAWACHATPDVVSTVEPSVAVAWLVTGQPVWPPSLHRASSTSTILHSRAPPVTALLSHG